MTRYIGRFVAVVLCSTALTGAAMAADLVLDVPSEPEAVSSDWGQFYLEVYGGATLNGTATISYNGNPSYDADLEANTTFGASFGVMTPIEGLAIELDVMKAGGGAYTAFPREGHTTYSAMVNAEYSLPLNDMFALYGAAGVGVINSVYAADIGDSYSAMGAGYQLAAGVRAAVTEGVSVFGEVKYQNSFGGIDISDPGGDVYSVQYPTVNVVAGLRFDF
jgi:opacity protein-like surface antigen